MKSFLQTTEWLEFQKEIGHKTWRFSDGKITANIIKLGLPLGKSFLYIPHGPEIEFENIRGGIKNELTSFIKYLKDLAREEKAIFVKLEPLSDMVMELLYRRGLKRSSKQIQPYRTVVIDLNFPEEHLLGRMHQKTRYNINLSEKKGLKLEESNDIDPVRSSLAEVPEGTRASGASETSYGVETFWKLLKQTATKDNFSTHPKEYYEKMLDFFYEGKELQTKLFLVKYGDRYIGGAIVMIYHPAPNLSADRQQTGGGFGAGHSTTAYYLHGAMDREHKSLMAPYFMHWEIIKWARVQGHHIYDFWGIDHRKWPGVTRFKLGWGGEQKEYPGSFDMPVSRLWYLAYSFARKVF